MIQGRDDTRTALAVKFGSLLSDVVGLYVAPPAKAIVLCVDEEALDPGFGASAGLSEVAQWPRLDRPKPRLQAAWHHNIVCGAVCVDVGIDVFLKLLEAREGGAAERLPLQDGKQAGTTLIVW